MSTARLAAAASGRPEIHDARARYPQVALDSGCLRKSPGEKADLAEFRSG
jgi:hypothetical protein